MRRRRIPTDATCQVGIEWRISLPAGHIGEPTLTFNLPPLPLVLEPERCISSPNAIRLSRRTRATRILLGWVILPVALPHHGLHIPICRYRACSRVLLEYVCTPHAAE